MKPLRKNHRKALVQTDRFCQSVGLGLQVLQECRQRHLQFSLFLFPLFYWKRNYLHRQNKINLHLFILQMLCRNWNRESGYVAFPCSHTELPDTIYNNVTSLKPTELLWLILLVSQLTGSKAEVYEKRKNYRANLCCNSLSCRKNVDETSATVKLHA